MEDKAFSSIDFVGQCLLDPKKARAFQLAINKAVNPGDTVLDVGTGSGILALFSAAAGAKKVIAMEFDPFVAKIAQENCRNNSYEDVIQVVVGDARTHIFKKDARFDVVTMEMLTSGMVDEMQVQAVNNLHSQGVVSSSTTFIPARQETYITLADVNFKLFGFDMNMVIHAWNYFETIKRADLSKETLLNSINFSETISEACDVVVKVKITKRGTINAIWFSSKAFVDGKKFLEDTLSLNPPVAIPVRAKNVSAGDIVDVHIKYMFGHGYQNFSADIN